MFLAFEFDIIKGIKILCCKSNHNIRLKVINSLMSKINKVLYSKSNQYKAKQPDKVIKILYSGNN